MIRRERMPESRSRRCGPRRRFGSVAAVVERLEERCLLSAFDTAQLLTLDAAGAGSVADAVSAPGGEMRRFTAPATGLITIEQHATNGNLNSHLFLFDDQHRLVATDDDSGGGLDSLLRFNVVAGRTYFVSSAAVGGTTGGYQLQFHTLQDNVGNFFFGPSLLVPLAADGSSDFTGQIEAPGDVDFIRFVTTVAGRVTVTLRAGPGSSLDPNLFAYEVAVRDAQGLPRLIASNDDRPGTLDSSLFFDAVAGSRYYVTASGFGGSTGGYYLSVRTTPADQVNDDAGDHLANAREVLLSATGDGFITGRRNFPEDCDVFQFTAPVTGRITARLTTPSTDTAAGMLKAYFSNQRIASSRPVGLDGVVTFDVEAGLTYFLQVAATETNQERYEIRLNTVPDESVRSRFVSELLTAERTAELLEHLDTAGIVSGLTSTTRQSRPGEVTQQINQSIVAALLDQVGGISSLREPVLLLWLDPVDFILTDSANRQIGFTQSQGRVNELGSNVYFSGNGFGELLMLPVSGGSYSLQLVGVGSGAVSYGASMITPVGVVSVTGAQTLLKGDAIVTLDFNQTPYTGPQAAGSVADASAAEIGVGGPAASIVMTSLLATIFADAASALADGDALSDTADDGGSRDETSDAAKRLAAVLRFQPRRLLGRLLNSLSILFSDVLLDEGHNIGLSGPSGELFDLLWQQLGGRLLGVPGRALDLSPIEKLFESAPRTPQSPPAPESPAPQSESSTDASRSSAATESN